MFSKREAKQLIIIAVYHSALFLIYSFIHPKLSLINFYYFPVALFVLNIVRFSSIKIHSSYSSVFYVKKKIEAPEVIHMWFGFVLFLYCISDIAAADSSSGIDPRMALDITFTLLIILGPKRFIIDIKELAHEADTTKKDRTDKPKLDKDQYRLLYVACFFESLILLAYMYFENRIGSYFYSLPIPMLLLALRLFTYDFVVTKKLRQKPYAIAVIILTNYLYVLVSFGFTTFALFSEFNVFYNNNLIFLTVALYTAIEFLIELGQKPESNSDKILKIIESNRSPVAWDFHKHAVIPSIPDRSVECVNCDFSIENPSSNLCPNCGSDIYLKSEYISCESCGSDYDRSADSCIYCGHIPTL